ncbi:hypothetical protein KY289_007594 [Solanum tuberosum]|nr:hypothetical protein KY289_007594 [Solanum tuberosum]
MNRGFGWFQVVFAGRKREENGCVCSLVWGSFGGGVLPKKEENEWGFWVAEDWPESGVVELSFQHYFTVVGFKNYS